MKTITKLINLGHGKANDAPFLRNNVGKFHAIVLSGGGIDSFMSTCAYLLTAHYAGPPTFKGKSFKGYKLTFLIINYGQQGYRAESSMTKAQAAFFTNLGVEVSIVEIDDPLMQHIRNPLKDRAAQKQNATGDYAKNDDYVPNRNARFVFAAAGLAETIDARTIVIGAVGNVNQDNSLAFLESAHNTIKNSNRDVFPNLYAPFVLMSKSAVALYAKEIDVVDELRNLSTSCFDSIELVSGPETPPLPYVKQCGECRSCSSLKQAFKFACVEDPYIYKGVPRTAVFGFGK